MTVISSRPQCVDMLLVLLSDGLQCNANWHLVHRCADHLLTWKLLNYNFNQYLFDKTNRLGKFTRETRNKTKKKLQQNIHDHPNMYPGKLLMFSNYVIMFTVSLCPCPRHYQRSPGDPSPPDIVPSVYGSRKLTWNYYVLSSVAPLIGSKSYEPCLKHICKGMGSVLLRWA